MTKKETRKEMHKHNKHEKERKELENLNNKIKELTDSLQRLQAEFENYKKRVEKEKQGFIKYASQDLIVKLLPIVDSFEIALKNHKDQNKFLEGMKLVFSQFYSILEKEGLKQINPLDEKFDPDKHEVLICDKSEKPDNTITEVLQKGYIVNDKLIRHAKVRIAKNK